MVAGGLTGVGIWAAISITATRGHLGAHHTASPWAGPRSGPSFWSEIVALLLYMREFDTAPPRRRLVLAWLYFAFAWGSLATVQGFISFMLTPGQWLATQHFWDGFFNPTFLPGLVMRMAIATAIVRRLRPVDRAGRGRRNPAQAPDPVVRLVGGPAPARGRGRRLVAHSGAVAGGSNCWPMGRSPEVAAAMRAFWVSLPVMAALCAALVAGLPRPLGPQRGPHPAGGLFFCLSARSSGCASRPAGPTSSQATCIPTASGWTGAKKSTKRAC